MRVRPRSERIERQKREKVNRILNRTLHVSQPDEQRELWYDSADVPFFFFLRPSFCDASVEIDHINILEKAAVLRCSRKLSPCRSKISWPGARVNRKHRWEKDMLHWLRWLTACNLWLSSHTLTEYSCKDSKHTEIQSCMYTGMLVCFCFSHKHTVFLHWTMKLLSANHKLSYPN